MPETVPPLPPRPEPSSGTSLSDREIQVLRGMASGQSNGEIGRRIYISEDTVKTHARRLFRKLGAHDRAHAVAQAFARGVLVIDPELGIVTQSREPAGPPPGARPPAPVHSKGAFGTVTLSCDERDVALLTGAVYPRDRSMPWAAARCREALRRLTGQTG